MSDIELDIREFYRSCNASRTLDVGKIEDRQYYVDLNIYRGGDSVKSLLRTITLLSPDKPTHQLFTGIIGSGKTTELLRLKAELEEKNYYVVYFASSGDLDLSDVSVNDVLLAIAREVSVNLELFGIKLKSGNFAGFFNEVSNFLQTPVSLSAELSLPLGLGKITSAIKESPSLRKQLRQLLETRTDEILELVNQQVLEIATEELKKQGKEGLVVIVDNLDRVGLRITESGKSQPEYLFLDRGEQLKKLNCHIVYTIPYFLAFLNYSKLSIRFENPPRMLPLVATELRDGSNCPDGLEALQQVVMARAFPKINPEQRKNLVTKVFDNQDTLNRICRVSGGHVRILQILLTECLMETDSFPISRKCLDKVIATQSSHYSYRIQDSDWDLLLKVHQKQDLNGELDVVQLISTMFIYPYADQDGNWLNVNPLLKELDKCKVLFNFHL